MRAYPARCNVVMVGLVLLALLSACVPNRKFSVERWKQSKPKDRQWMADDFLQTHNTVGMSIDEVKDLLGAPDYGQSSIVYYLDSDVPVVSPRDFYAARDALYVWLLEGVVTGTRLPDSAAAGRQAFDAVVWKTSPPVARLAMCNNLIGEGTLQGLTVDEVVTLLGTPDEWEINYYLGVRMIDNVTLTFILDRNRRVIAAQKIEH